MSGEKTTYWVTDRSIWEVCMYRDETTLASFSFYFRSFNDACKYIEKHFSDKAIYTAYIGIENWFKIHDGEIDVPMPPMKSDTTIYPKFLRQVDVLKMEVV